MSTDPGRTESPSPAAAFLVLAPGRAAWATGIAAAIVVAALSLLYVRSHPPFAAALGIAAALLAVITLLTLAPPWQPLRLTHRGLSFATTFKRFELRWSDVRAFGMAHVGGLQLVCMTYARAGSTRARFGLFDWFLPSHYGMSAEGLARTLEHTRARLSVDQPLAAAADPIRYDRAQEATPDATADATPNSTPDSTPPRTP